MPRSAPRGAGAAIAHIHVREPKTGQGSMELAYYREVVESIGGERGRCC